MENIANWTATVLTIVAALMTAANLGARVTGWGFAMFALGSVAWIAADLSGAKVNPSLLVTHSVLLLVNLFGVWRWLGRQTRYEDSSAHASERSRWARVPTLFSAGSLIGATVRQRKEESRGTVVDAMLRCDDKGLAYVVISEGGIGGAGETLRAVPPDHLKFDENDVVCDLSDEEWQRLPPIEEDRWPTAAPDTVR
ncbi:MAG TPA: PRC-barrel domain-containing protein [Woeseiaceae bacterium]|nr:PRC-barrel domain-containing protein [Woeseiaceae bacterium]